MKIITKKVIHYIGIFILVLTLLLISLLATMKIPKKAIETNLKKSTEYFSNKSTIEMLQLRREYTYLHLWSESALLNIINCVDTDNVLESVMLDRYYQSEIDNPNIDFIDVVQNNKEPNTQYLRYWHGSMTLLRPCLIFFSIQEIFNINYVIINILFFTLLIILLKKNKKLALLYVISMIMIVFPMVAISLLYSWTFYIMIITSIIAIFIEKKGNEALFKLFFITGIVTCFFDFLTTEIITLYVPILFVLFLRKQENKNFDFKESFKFVLKASLIWGLAYASMFLAKWLLASLVLKTNAFQYVSDNLKLRINGTENIITLKELYSNVIPLNFWTLYPIGNIKGTKRQIRLFFGIILVLVLLIDWKNINKKKYSILMLLIATIPYARYLVLANHSYKHFFFTFREQIITIIAIGLFIIENFNYNLWCKKIRIKKHKSLEEKEINE